MEKISPWTAFEWELRKPVCALMEEWRLGKSVVLGFLRVVSLSVNSGSRCVEPESASAVWYAFQTAWAYEGEGRCIPCTAATRRLSHYPRPQVRRGRGYPTGPQSGTLTRTRAGSYLYPPQVYSTRGIP